MSLPYLLGHGIKIHRSELHDAVVLVVFVASHERSRGRGRVVVRVAVDVGGIVPPTRLVGVPRASEGAAAGLSVHGVVRISRAAPALCVEVCVLDR